MPIKILYLIDDLYAARGGSEQHLLWLLKTIPVPEFEKHFIIFSTFWKPEAVEEDLNAVVLGQKFGVSWKTYFNRIRFLVRFIRENRIDIVQAFSSMGELAGFIAVFFANRFSKNKTKLVGNRRDCGYNRSTKHRWINWLTRFCGTKYIANSEAAKQSAYKNDKTPLSAVTVIRNPVSNKRIEDGLANPLKRAELNIPEEARSGKLVGIVATVRPVKNYETLLRAFRIVSEKFSGSYLLCIGEQRFPYKDTLDKLTSELGISEKVIWYGGVSNPLKIIPNFDAAVLSSKTESFSNTVLEYAVAECPIVVTDVGGLGEIIENGRSGFIVPSKNPEKLAEKIIIFLENPELGKRFGSEAKNFVLKQYDEKKILEQYVDFYRSLSVK